MHDGLKLVLCAGGYYGRGVWRVGWLKRVEGDEWSLLNACVIWRNGSWDPDGLDRAAVEGPKTSYSTSTPSKTIEHVHRLTILRAIACVPDAWAKACPKPSDWNVDR